MNLTLLRAALVAASVIPLSSRAALNPAEVGADARWVVHADFNALRASSLGAQLVQAASQMQHHMTAGGISLNVPKLLETLGSATAYGSNFSKEPSAIDGTLVLRGTPELRTIAEGLLLQTTLTHPQIAAELGGLPFPAYSLGDPKQPAAGVVIAFPPEPIVLVGKSKAQLLKAREVMNGKAPSLAKNSAAPLHALLRPSRDAYLFVASALPPDLFDGQDAPQARILKMADTLAVALGETGANTFAHAELVATSDEMADKLMKILQGMTAMLSLAETSDRQLAEFLNSTRVSRDGSKVSLQLAYPTERLVQMFTALQQRRHTMERKPQTPPIASGRVLAEWTADNRGDEPSQPATRIIDSVTLKNGATITLGRSLNGGRAVRFTQLEIAPADGSGAPLVFGPEWIGRGNMAHIRFPGVDGTYRLKATYINDGSGKATYAISVREAKPAAADGHKAQ